MKKLFDCIYCDLWFSVYRNSLTDVLYLCDSPLPGHGVIMMQDAEGQPLTYARWMELGKDHE